MSRDLWVFVSDEAETSTGPAERVADNLSFFDLSPLLKVALELVVSELVV
jgi:hypothetical protein